MPSKYSHSPSQGLIRPYSGLFSELFRLTDLVLIYSSFYLATRIQQVEWSIEFTIAGVVAMFVFLVVSQLSSLYNSWRMTGLHEELMQIILIWFTVFSVLLFMAYSLKISDVYSRRAIITWFFLAPFTLYALRICVRDTLSRFRNAGRNLRSAVVIGEGSPAERICDLLESSPELGIKLKGYYRYDPDSNDYIVARKTGARRDSRNLATLISEARQNRIDLAFISLPLDKHAEAEKIVSSFSDTTVNVFFIPTLFMNDLLNSRWGYLDDIPYLSLHESPFYGLDGTLKRMEDVFLSLFILTMIAIPMLLIAAGIKLTSKGPVLFKQRRYGLNNQEVIVWKFRTMTVQEDGAHVRQAQRNDTRVTRFGAILRRTSLDELPQFINVLQGHMSIVGPRPHAVAHNEQYRKEIYGYTLRHKVKPGITGWAQVNGWRGETDTSYKMRQRVDHDLWYINHWSILLDFKIIVMTVVHGFIDKRAY